MPSGRRDGPDPAEPLLATKLFAPRGRRTVVRRERLLRRLRGALGGALTLVTAPAGFGKTTLVADWLQTLDRPYGWLTLDELDNDGRRFAAYLLAALRQVRPDFGVDLARRLDGATLDDPAFLVPFVHALGADLPDAVLVLDDYHVLQGPVLHAFVSALVEHLPPNLHLVLTSRDVPPLPLGRLRVAGSVTEIGAADLRASVDEASAFLRDGMRLALGDDAVSLLAARTEGWMAGLQLAAIGLQDRRDPEAFLKDFGGDHRLVLDYLGQEVVDRLPPEVRDFLLRTSILGRLTGPLCDALTGRRDGSEMLERLEAGNVFVVPLDERRRWYRYHHLFAELLRARLEREAPDEVQDLHRRAAAWSGSRGNSEEAVQHAIAAGDWDEALARIEETAQATVLRGGAATLFEWVQALPDEAVRANPQLSLFHAWALMMTGRYEGMEDRLREVEGAYVQRTTPPTVRGRIAALRATVASIFGNFAVAEPQARIALEDLGSGDAAWRGLVLQQLATAHAFEGAFAEAIPLYEESLRVNEAAGNAYDVQIARWRLARIALARGEAREAERALRRVWTDLQEVGLAHLPGSGYVQVDLGTLYLLQDRREEAEEALRRGLAHLRSQGAPTIRLDGLLATAELARANGDEATVASFLREADELVRDRNMPARFALQVAVARARGHMGAHRWADARAELPPLDALDAAVPWQEDALLVHAEALRARRRFDEALDLVRAVEEARRRRGASGALAPVEVQRAITSAQAGRTGEAAASLRSALERAVETGLVRPLLERHAALRKVHDDLAAHGVPLPDLPVPIPGAAPPHDQGARREVATLPLEPFSDRELELLPLLAGGMSNKEMARQLDVSVNTIKTHVRHIYEKLAVNSRAKLVARLEELALL